MMASLARIGALARLIFVDGLRRRALLGLFLLAVSVEIGGLFFFNFVPRDIGRVLVDYVVSIGWAAGLLYLLFHAVQVLSWGDDRRVIQTLLAHPMSRTEYVLGLFWGLLCLLLVLNAALGVLSYAVLLVVKNSVGVSYFSQLGLLEYLLAWLGVVLIEMMMLAVIALVSGLVRGGFSVLLLTVAYYLICNGLAVALDFVRSAGGLSYQLMVALSFCFPNFSRWDYKGLVVMLDGAPALAILAFDIAYALLYCVLVLALAARIYQRRDIK